LFFSAAICGRTLLLERRSFVFVHSILSTHYPRAPCWQVGEALEWKGGRGRGSPPLEIAPLAAGADRAVPVIRGSILLESAHAQDTRHALLKDAEPKTAQKKNANTLRRRSWRHVPPKSRSAAPSLAKALRCDRHNDTLAQPHSSNLTMNCFNLGGKAFHYRPPSLSLPPTQRNCEAPHRTSAEERHTKKVNLLQRSRHLT
jgi:hypothetical protein